MLIDESAFNEPPLTLAGAVVYQRDRATVDERVRSLHQELCESFFMDGERSFEKFRRNGFHATDDPVELHSAFVLFISQNPGAKLFIEHSDHTKRPELTRSETVALLEVRLVETTLRKYNWAPQIHFTFERNSDLDAYYERIVQTAARRSRYAGEARVSIGGKMNPPALSVVDYALVSYGRTRQYKSLPHHHRTWKAIRPMVSSIRSLDAGGIEYRRGLASHATVVPGEGASS